MSHFVIEGGQKLHGSIPVYGSKNAALPALAASLLTRQPVTYHNIPDILDVAHLYDILTALGAKVEQKNDEVIITAATVNQDQLPEEIIGKLRGSVLLLGAFLGRDRHVKLPRPGGDIIGARPLTAHLDGFTQLGAQVHEDKDYVTIDGAAMKAGIVVLNEFSVTATENIMLVAATLPGTTTIEIAATEPHVVALAQLLTAMGARVRGAGTHTITIEGSQELHSAHHTNIDDMLEAGAFILLAAATQSELTIENVPLADLLLFFKKISEIGIQVEINEAMRSVVVKPGKLNAFKLQTLPHPGIATDLQAPFSVIATKAAGTSLIHDPLYEGRFRHIAELQKMGANVTVCDPHRVIVVGPTPLRGQRIPSLDIRSGITLLIAGLTAEGTTIIEPAEIIDRGYAKLAERLTAIGAHIKREG